MRDLLINRIVKIKSKNGDFSISLVAWKNFMVDGIHLSEINKVLLETKTDKQLIDLFERILNRCAKNDK